MVYRVKEILQLVKEPIDILFCFTIVNKGVGHYDGLAQFTLISIFKAKEEL